MPYLRTTITISGSYHLPNTKSGLSNEEICRLHEQEVGENLDDYIRRITAFARGNGTITWTVKLEKEPPPAPTPTEPESPPPSPTPAAPAIERPPQVEAELALLKREGLVK